MLSHRDRLIQSCREERELLMNLRQEFKSTKIREHLAQLIAELNSEIEALKGETNEHQT